MFPELQTFTTSVSKVRHCNVNAMRAATLLGYDVRDLYITNSTVSPKTKITVRLGLACLVDAGQGRAVIQGPTAPVINATLQTSVVGLGGMDQRLSAGGWNLFLVGGDADKDGLIDSWGVIASQSLNSPALPAGMTYKRLISWFPVYTSGTTNIVRPFHHQSNYWFYHESQTLLSGTATTTNFTIARTALDVSEWVSPQATEAFVQIGMLLSTSNGDNIKLYDPTQDARPSLFVYGSPSGDDANEASGWTPVIRGSVDYSLLITPKNSEYSITIKGFSFPLRREI